MRSLPETSLEAYTSIEPHIPALEAIILTALREQGKKGATIDELVTLTGRQKVSISGRMKPMTEKGLAVRGDDRRPGDSGRNQTIWRAA